MYILYYNTYMYRRQFYLCNVNADIPWNETCMWFIPGTIDDEGECLPEYREYANESWP
jgi:hypothetical protein